MSYTKADIAAAELAVYQADKPAILAGSSWATNYAGSAYWATSQSSTTDAGQGTTSAYLYDIHQHLQSYTDVGATTTWVKAKFSPMTVDTVGLLNCNLYDVASVTLYFADDEALSTNVWTVVITHNAVENVSTNNINLQTRKRLMFPNLFASGVPQRLFALEYLGIKIVTATNRQPLIGELLIGTRRQLYTGPEVPWAKWSYESDIATSTSLSGVQTSYVRHLGKRRLNGVVRAWQSSRTADLESALGSDIRYGADPFVWMDAPWTTPHPSPWFRLDSPAMTGPYLGPFEREFAIDATEVGSSFVALE